MKVKDLIQELTSLDPEMQVIIQKDSEGNGYSPLAGVDSNAIYEAETTWFGEVYDSRWSADDACMGLDEWQEILSKPRCVVLFPVN